MATEEFAIFQNVPLPTIKRGVGFGPRQSKYPFKDMDVGDMLVIPGKTVKQFGPTARAAEKRTGLFFALRSGPVDDGEGTELVPKGSIGVFRIASKAPRKSKKG